MGFVTIKDQDGVEHQIHTSQLPVLNQQCTPTYACQECDKLRADLAAARRELAAYKRAKSLILCGDAVHSTHYPIIVATLNGLEGRVAELLAREGVK